MKLLQLLLFSLFLAGCSVLKPIDDAPVRHLLESSVPARVPTLASPVIAIARPSLPPYLERSELVTRTGKGQLTVHENDLWSEPLDAAIARVIAEGLRHRTGSSNIQASGNFISREYSSVVEIRIDRFDPSTEGVLLLECTWKAQAVEGGDASARAFRTEVAFDPSVDPMSRRIEAMNEALSRLTREIAEVL